MNIFNLQRQPIRFDDIQTSTLNWVEHFVFVDKFDVMCAAQYDLFLIDDEPEYDVFEFDDLCFTFESLIAAAFKSDSPPASLEMKPLSESL